jgi:Fe(3+) dicitrate transport protein
MDLGYRGQLARDLLFDVGGFILQYNDRIGTLQRDGAAYRTNIGDALSRGLEAYVESEPLRRIPGLARFGRLSLFASVALIDARYSRWNDPSMGEDDAHSIEGKRLENAPRRIERYGLNYHYRRVSLTAQISRVGDVFTDATNTVVANATATVGRLPAYDVIDASATLSLDHGIELKAGVDNLADARYATRRSGGYPGPGILPGNGRTAYLTLVARF